MNNVIINLATGRYIVGAERLKQSLLDNNYKGDFLFFTEESQVGSPTHFENPYAFKTYAIQYALNLGYTKILWLDASVYAINDIDIVWKTIEEQGFLMKFSGWYSGTWANDFSLNYFNITREEAFNMPMYGDAGLLGLNFESEIANLFFDKWHKSSQDGVFKGAWNNNEKTESQDERCLGHRHDMTAGSIIANLLGMNNNFFASNEILQYASPTYEVLNDTIIFKAQGM